MTALALSDLLLHYLSLQIFLSFFQRQLEIFHLTPNTTYEFRIWGNNKLGAGEKAIITATTSSKTEEKGKQPTTFAIHIVNWFMTRLC